MTLANSDNFYDVITMVAPTGGVVAGTCYLIQNVVCLALTTASATANFSAKIFGRVANAPTASSQAWTAGAKVYWDNTNHVFTTSSTGNTIAGRAAATKASTPVLGDVILLQA